jgi:hypothetical protein
MSNTLENNNNYFRIFTFWGNIKFSCPKQARKGVHHSHNKPILQVTRKVPCFTCLRVVSITLATNKKLRWNTLCTINRLLLFIEFPKQSNVYCQIETYRGNLPWEINHHLSDQVAQCSGKCPYLYINNLRACCKDAARCRVNDIAINTWQN